MAIPVNARRLTRGAWGAALLALAGFAAPVAAEEENWRDFTFEDKGFAIQFPIQPTREEVRYRAAVSGGGEVEVPATRITVTQDHTTYDVTVAEFTGTAAADPDAIDYAVERLRKRGPTGLDTLVSIANGECGRYIGYADPDGTLNYYGLFYFPHNQRFYDIHARVPPSDQSDHGAGASHFGLSLNFLASAAPPPPPKPDWPAEWKEYIYTNPEFSIRFPAAPKVESLKFRSPAGVVVPARRFSLRTGDTEFRVTAAKYWQSAADTVDTGQAALAGGEQWARAETARGRKIVYDRVASLSRAQCGRELRSSGPVEKHVRVFFPATQHWLYIVEAAGPKAAADRAALFQAGFAVTAAPEPAEVPPQQPVEQQ